MKAEVPIIVAEQDFANQTATLPIITLFTPTTDGLFKLSAYLETGDGDPSHRVRASIAWTDDFRAESPEGAAIQIQGGTVGAQGTQGNVVLRAKAGTAITVSTSTDTILATPYSLFVAIESL